MSKNKKIYMTPASRQMFFNRDYADYPDIKTRYGVPHPAEIIKNLRESLIQNPDQENWAEQLRVFIETSPLYQLGYETLAKAEKQKALLINQLRERKKEDSSVLEENDDDEDDSRMDVAKDLFVKIFSVEQKEPEDEKWIRFNPQASKNFLYNAYIQKSQVTELTKIPEIVDVIKINALLKTDVPKIQEKYREIWKNYKVLNNFSVLLNDFFQTDREFGHLQNLDRVLLDKFEIKDTLVTEMQQRKLLQLHIGLSDLLAVLRSLAKLNNHKQLEDSEVKMIVKEPLKLCLGNTNLVKILNAQLTSLKQKYDNELAIRTFKAITLYLETISPLIARLSSFTDFQQLEEYRQNLLKQMEILNILPDNILKTSAEVSVQYERADINKLLKEMTFRIKHSYFNPAYIGLLEKIDNNREKFHRLNRRQQELNPNSTEFSQNKSVILALDEEHTILALEGHRKYPDEWKKHKSILSLMPGLSDFVKKEAIFPQPENLSILGIYQEWYEKMALEINRLRRILPRLIDIAGTHTIETDSKSSQRLQHEGHQRMADQASLFTVQSRVSSVLVFKRDAHKVSNLELKEDKVEGNLFEFLKIKPALQDCHTYGEQWDCLQSLVEKITQKTDKASGLSVQWKARFLAGNTTTDACLIPKNGEQAALAKELISSLSKEQHNPLLGPIYDFAEANLLLISKMDQILKIVGVNPELDNRGREAIKQSYTQLAPLLKEFYELYVDNEVAARKLCAVLQEIGGEFLSTEELYQSLLSYCGKMEVFFSSLHQPCTNPTSASDSFNLFDRFKVIPTDLNNLAKNWYTDFENERTHKLKSVFNPLQDKELPPITLVTSSTVDSTQPGTVVESRLVPPPLLSRVPQRFVYSDASTLSSSSSSSSSSSHQAQVQAQVQVLLQLESEKSE